MLAMHMFLVVQSKDVIKLLLRDETITIRVDVPKRQRDLLDPVLFKHHIYELLLRQRYSFLDL